MFGNADETYLVLIAKPLVIGVAAAILYAAVAQANQRGEIFHRLRLVVPRAIGATIPIILVGYFAGYLISIGGSVALKDILPGLVLSLVGGANVFIAGKTTDNKALPIYTIFVFAMMLFYGLMDAGYERAVNLESRLIAKADQESRIRLYRLNLGLPPDPPGWTQ